MHHIRFTRFARHYMDVVLDSHARQSLDQRDREFISQELKDGHVLDFMEVDGDIIELVREIKVSYPEAIILSIDII